VVKMKRPDNMAHIQPGHYGDPLADPNCRGLVRGSQAPPQRTLPQRAADAHCRQCASKGSATQSSLLRI
jgi:hypothetical protein